MGVVTALRRFCTVVLLATIGAAAPPPQGLIVALGDSITYGYLLPRPATQNYAALYASRMGARLVDLAQSGYTCGGVVRDELPKMPEHAAIVIVNCGTNDLRGFVFRPPNHSAIAPAATDAETNASMKTFAALLRAVRAKEPNAIVLLVNVRHWQRMSGPPDPQFVKDVDRWNAMLGATGLRVVDVDGDSRLYQPRYVFPDWLHPTELGHQAMAQDFP
jgi:lysophospholipase L1-like esterase